MRIKKKRIRKKEKGSALVLTLIAVLLLSGLAITGLTVSSTEVQSTGNFLLNKRAYYAALEGVEAVRNEIFRQPDPESVTAIQMDLPQTKSGGGPNYTYYITGSMEDLRYYTENQTAPPTVNFFAGFPPPPLAGISLTGSANVAPVIWRVHITSSINVGKRKAYAEIESGIYSIVTVSY
ncbi:MAG: pilus assembly PilX N-terminal domain-containing protein [Candidatus Aminicenantes bacterium]|nr:pilus assembly PilX N-terminal domain-containing protein [Candidatus Aminicenantes bacterium]